MPAAPALHRKVAASLCRQLYTLTEQLLENDPSFQAYCAMHDALVKKEIPRIWPKVKRETLARLSVGLPAVNYITGNRRADAKQIERMLLVEFPPVVPRRKKARAKTKQRA